MELKDYAFLIPSIIFSILLYSLLQLFISGELADKLGGVVSLNSFAIMDYIIFFYLIALFVSFFASMFLTYNKRKVLLTAALGLSFVSSIFVISAISYYSLLFTYPEIFGNVDFLDLIFNFFTWNTYYIAYILYSFNFFFFILYLLYLVFTVFWFSLLVRFFEVRKQKTTVNKRRRK